MSAIINLPRHWQLKKLDDLLDFYIGGDWGKNEDFKDENFDFAFCIRGSEIKDWSKTKGNTASLRKIKKTNIEKRKLQVGDILVEISGGGPEQPVGRTVLVDKSVLSYKPEIPKICTNFLRLIRPSNDVNPCFLNWYLTRFYFSGEIIKYQAGSNNLRNLKFPDYLKIDIPIPPLPEQQAIVSKIEKLLSELENGTQQLLTAQQQLKVYRQSLLKWAFEGKLTNKNVKEGDLPKGWKKVKIEEIATVGTGATPLKGNKKYYENGKIAWITSGALNNEFVMDATDFVTELALKETNLSVYPKHTLLLAMYGEGKTRGKCSELLIEASTNQAIAAIDFKNHDERVRPFLKYFLLKNYNDIRRLSSGGVQPNLNLGIVKKTVVPFPTIEEQQLIVSELESKLTVCDKIDETISLCLQQAETLRQSILKKAFEGTLI